MSNSLHHKKLEEQRQRQLSRQVRRREMMSNSIIANSEDVEYIHAYDNPGATIEDSIASKSPSRSRKKNSKQRHSKSSSSKPQPNQISKLIDVSDDDDDLVPSTANTRAPQKLDALLSALNGGDENNNGTTIENDDQGGGAVEEGDGELTPRNTSLVQKNEELFCISDGSSESDYSMRDDVSIANGAVGVRPQTAQPSASRPETAMSSTSFQTNSKAAAGSGQSQPRQPFTFIPGMEHIQSVKEFVFTAAPWDHKDAQAIRARITRDKKSSKFGGVKYFMHLEMPNSNSHRQFILSARKCTRAKTSNYLISTDVDNITRESDNIVGKLRSNALGTRFVAFDNGAAPTTSLAMRNHDNIRREMCMVMYDTNILGFHGPRRMTLIIPGMEDNEQMTEKVRCECRPTTDADSIASRFDRDQMDSLIQLENKKPIWNQDTQSFVLNFHGRVTMASVKNFQIIHKDNPNYIIMQFGRISEDVFTIDYRYPMSAFQSFAIALSSFDSKLACE